MTSLKKIFLAASSIVLSLSVLTACGRSGAPELPASSYQVNDHGQKVEKPKADKPFILDRLIE